MNARSRPPARQPRRTDTVFPMKAAPLFLALALVLPQAGRAQSLSNTVFQKHRAEVEAAVDRGLAFLAETQSADGTYRDSYGRSVGIVSLVGMAFLSAGHTPGYGEYASHLARCIEEDELKLADFTNLSNDEIRTIQYAFERLADDDSPMTLKPVYDALQGRYDYGLLRCVRAGIAGG